MPRRQDPNWAAIDPDVAEYVDGLAYRGDAALQEVERQGDAEGWPIVGAAEGSFLHVLAKGIGARRILELGTAIGYSGTWFARALPDDGQLVTVEADPKTARIAQGNFEKTGVASKVKVMVGQAQDVIQNLRGPFDLVFVDINKDGYPGILQPSIERLRVGGLLVTDNVLWHGDVARKSVRTRETQAIRTYNEALAKDSRMIASILPIRDGVSVALKLRP
jgi:predicted O-methyltransferase YrrM